jgi:hypothetical protein
VSVTVCTSFVQVVSSGMQVPRRDYVFPETLLRYSACSLPVISLQYFGIVCRVIQEVM